MDVSFVLLTWNSENYIKKCLDSLIKDSLTNLYHTEIFVVDNGSIDNTANILKSFGSQYKNLIVPIFLKKNIGTTISRNLALKKSKGKIIVVMDSDVEVPQGITHYLVSSLSINKSIGILVPRLVYSNGCLQKSTDIFPTILTKVYRYFFLRQIERKESLFVNPGVTEVDYAIAAVWAFRSKMLEEVGFLDENIFYAPEDVDYCYRTWKAGYKVIYDPRIVCVHHTQELSRGYKINKSTLEHIKGLFYYFKKHGYIFKIPKKIKNK